MFRRKGLALVAACAAMACTGMVRAADVDTSYDSNSFSLSNNQPVSLDDATPRKPLMAGLDKIGVAKGLDALGLNVYGYIEGGWTFDFSNPPDGPGGVPSKHIVGRSFDTQSNSILLDQLDLVLERTVDLTKKKFDVGFRIEQIYGADSAYIHSNGLTIYSPARIGDARTPKVQYDLNQAYLDLAFGMVGNGLDIRLGKWNTLLGYEVISPTGNPFYSHSFMFFNLPFTQTGALATYNISDSLSFTGGMSRGWDQATNDTNGDIDLTGQLKYTKGKFTGYINGTTGNEEASGTLIPGTTRGLDGWRSVIDVIGTYAYSDNLTLAVNADYGWEAQKDNGGTAQWYGIAGYAGYTISDMFTFNARGEIFDDQDGEAPASLTPGVPNQYIEATLGLSIKPFAKNNFGSNLVIRPEVRFDYADHAAFDPIGGVPTGHYQWTTGLDAYFTF